MNRYCNGCSYKVHTENDKYKTWGFCIYDSIINKCIAEGNNSDFDMNSFLKRELKRMSIKGTVPSCMLVQSCFEGSCPYYTKNKTEVR